VYPNISAAPRAESRRRVMGQSSILITTRACAVAPHLGYSEELLSFPMRKLMSRISEKYQQNEKKRGYGSAHGVMPKKRDWNNVTPVYLLFFTPGRHPKRSSNTRVFIRVSCTYVECNILYYTIYETCIMCTVCAAEDLLIESRMYTRGIGSIINNNRSGFSWYYICCSAIVTKYSTIYYVGLFHRHAASSCRHLYIRGSFSQHGHPK